ncbi:sulfite reductase flavoprotein alpha-component, partial [Colletotrichum orchidophilum]
ERRAINEIVYSENPSAGHIAQVKNVDTLVADGIYLPVFDLGMLCSIYRYEDNNDGYDGVIINSIAAKPRIEMSDDLRPSGHIGGKFSAPLSKRCPVASVPSFPPFLLEDGFHSRNKYVCFLGNEGLHLRAWLPTNLRAFIASVEYYYWIPEYVRESDDAQLMGVLDGIIEAYAGEEGLMGTHSSMIALDLHNTGIALQPGDRLVIMPLISWEEYAKIAAGLGLNTMLDRPVLLDRRWSRFAEPLETVSNHGVAAPCTKTRKLMVKDIFHRGHLAPLTQDPRHADSFVKRGVAGADDRGVACPWFTG